MKEDISSELLKQTQEKIKEILDNEISPNNLENLDKLVDILKDTKEVECMNYGNYGNYGRSYGEYGRRAGYDSYGEYGRDSYGRRGYDTKYRGYDKINEMSNEYGRYQENRERYGASSETNKSLKYMLESMEDFARMLKEDAQSQEEVEMIRQTAQRIAQM